MIKRLRALALGLASFGTLLPTAVWSQEHPPFAADFYRVHVQEYGYGRVERVILFRRLQRDEATGARWLVEKRERVRNLGSPRIDSYAWIDSIDCDDVGVILRRLDLLPPLAIRGPTSLASPGSMPAFHQPIVTLEAGPVNLGGSEVRLNVVDSTGPVAKWWRESQEAVKHCWRESDVMLDGIRVPPGLPEIEAWRD